MYTIEQARPFSKNLLDNAVADSLLITPIVRCTIKPKFDRNSIRTIMAYQNRPVNPSLRHPSMGSSQPSTGQSPMLLARINEKKAELENLKQLRDLSGGLAAQMQALEEKLSTLSDGTEGQ